MTVEGRAAVERVKGWTLQLLESGDTVGAFYLGFAGPNDDPSGAQSQPSPVDPGQGIIGLQH